MKAVRHIYAINCELGTYVQLDLFWQALKHRRASHGAMFTLGWHGDQIFNGTKDRDVFGARLPDGLKNAHLSHFTITGRDSESSIKIAETMKERNI